MFSFYQQKNRSCWRLIFLKSYKTVLSYILEYFLFAFFLLCLSTLNKPNTRETKSTAYYFIRTFLDSFISGFQLKETKNSTSVIRKKKWQLTQTMSKVEFLDEINFSVEENSTIRKSRESKLIKRIHFRQNFAKMGQNLPNNRVRNEISQNVCIFTRINNREISVFHSLQTNISMCI